MDYRVGQVLYVILKKEASVYPMQVIEQITKRTLNGEETSYILRAGADHSKTLNINEIDGELFDSSEVARQTLIDRVSKMVSGRVDSAISKAKEWYPSGFEHAAEDTLSIIKKTAGYEQQPAAQRKIVGSSMKQEIVELTQELQADSDSLMMEMPDGKGGTQQVKVRNVKLPSTVS